VTATVTWLRPEFKGRENELVALAEGARLVGVTRAAVSNWAARHKTFPALVLLVGPAERPTKFVVREEFLGFAECQLKQGRGAQPGAQPSPRRPRAVILAERVQHLDRQERRLAELEAKHKRALKRTRSRLARTRKDAAEARTALEIEIAAAKDAAEALARTTEDA